MRSTPGKKFGAAAALAATTLTALATGPAAPEAQADPLVWGPCPERVESPGALCATATVPVDYSNPEGDLIELTVLRIPARGESRGVLFGNPGGPGGDALTYFDDNPVLQYPGELRDEFDLIAVQPRGLPDATPLECAPLDYADMGMLVSNAGGAQRAACEETMPGYTQHVTTENTARDWDEVRRSLGQERINILGLSYGTLLGSTYATLFPQHTDRLVLDSGVDPAWVWNDVLGQQDPAYIARFHDMLGWMASQNEVYGLGETPLQVYQRWSNQVAAEAGVPPTVAPPAAQIGDVPPGLEAVAQAYVDGATLTGPTRVAFEGLVAQVLVPGATQITSPTLAMTRQNVPQSVFWPQLAESLASGELPEEAAAAQDIEALDDDMVTSQRMQNIIMCNENQVEPRPLDYPAFLWHSFVTGDIFHMNGPMFTSGAACAGAGPVTGPLPINGDALETTPLMVQNQRDPQTPWHGARQLADQMGAHMITAAGGDHGVFAKGNEVVDDAVLEYLRTGSTDVTEAPDTPIAIG